MLCHRVAAASSSKPCHDALHWYGLSLPLLPPDLTAASSETGFTTPAFVPSSSAPLGFPFTPPSAPCASVSFPSWYFSATSSPVPSSPRLLTPRLSTPRPSTLRPRSASPDAAPPDAAPEPHLSRQLPRQAQYRGEGLPETHRTEQDPGAGGGLPEGDRERDVWGPAASVDDYTRYTTVFPFRSKGKVVDVLIPWIRTVCLKLRERFGQDLLVLHLHSDRGGEFSSNLLRDICCGEVVLHSFMLPGSPKQNGIAKHRIGLVMEVAHTSMIHAAAPHFLWPFKVRYAAHQLNLWPRVSLPETLPTLRWTREVGDASVFWV
ncbi:unnamed protein product [Closterium sp. NIES-54]